MSLGRLYVVATPIGNLEDISPRALRVLREADLIAAEDTRHSARLLEHFGIQARLVSYHDHNEADRAAMLIAALRSGESVALITDAGTPCIADPGYRAVRAAHDAGIPVVAVPGPSAALAALSVSGLPTDSFSFHGFFPRKRKQAEALLDAMRAGGTHLFFESPNRLVATLEALEKAVGEASCCVARELTKVFEEVVPGSPACLVEHFSAAPVRGECVVVVYAPPTREVPAPDPDLLRELVRAAMRRDGLSRRDAIRRVAAELRVPRNAVYAAARDEDA